MSEYLLEVKDLSVSAEEKEILHSLNLSIGKGETHVLMGPNGAGKSTLGNVIMGNSVYAVTKGTVYFDGLDITETRTDERARAGLFMSFQSPIEVPGITVSQFIRTAMDAKSAGRKTRLKIFHDKLDAAVEALGINPAWTQRELNVGFSGGERKKIEMLQLLMLEPKLAILDETDSGLDVDAVKTVSRGIEAFQRNTDRSLLIITHNSKILEYLHVDFVHVIVGGTIVKTGGAGMIHEINENGYEQFVPKQEAQV